MTPDTEKEAREPEPRDRTMPGKGREMNKNYQPDRMTKAIAMVIAARIQHAGVTDVCPSVPSPCTHCTISAEHAAAVLNMPLTQLIGWPYKKAPDAPR